MGAPGRVGLADGGAERAHPRRLLRDVAIGPQGVGIIGLQGYLAHAKRPPPQEDHSFLGIGLLKSPPGGEVSYERGTPVGFREWG